MRILVVLSAVGLMTACSSDVFVSADGGTDASEDVSSNDASVTDVHKPDAVPFEAASASIECGKDSCDPKSQVCCGMTSWSSESCVASSGCTAVSSAALACDDETDCQGSDVCCANIVTVTTSIVQSSQCKSNCNGGSSEIQLCRVSGECQSGSCAPLPSGSSPSWLEQCQ